MKEWIAQGTKKRRRGMCELRRFVIIGKRPRITRGTGIQIRGCKKIIWF